VSQRVRFCADVVSKVSFDCVVGPDLSGVFGTLALSARMFPQNYDWRYRVISNLLSPRDNPGHCWLPACGIILTAGLMLPFAGYLRRNLESASPRAANASSGAFIAGIRIKLNG